MRVKTCIEIQIHSLFEIWSLRSNGGAHSLRGDAGSNPAMSHQNKEKLFFFYDAVSKAFMLSVLLRVNIFVVACCVED